MIRVNFFTAVFIALPFPSLIENETDWGERIQVLNGGSEFALSGAFAPAFDSALGNSRWRLPAKNFRRLVGVLPPQTRPFYPRRSTVQPNDRPKPCDLLVELKAVF